MRLLARKNDGSRGGYALILAIVVIAALATIATAFLLTARGSARSSARRVGDARALLEADAATAALVRRLEATDPEVDPTPGYDDAAEAAMTLDLPDTIYRLRDPSSAVVSAHATPEQARIHVASASPQAFGVAFGTAFLTAKLDKEATEIVVDDASSFPERGCLWIEGELVRYGRRSGSTFQDCVRGTLGSPAGPYEEAAAHAAGSAVLDARAHHLAKHRIRALRGGFRPYASVAEITLAAMEPESCPPITAVDLVRLEPFLTQWSARNGHDDWSAPVRIVSAVDADGLQRSFRCDQPGYLGPGATVRLEGPGGVEYGIVVRNQQGNVTLEEPFTTSHAAFQARVSALVPHAIHVNSAPPELLERLLVGLDLRGGTPDPVARESARDLARRIAAEPVKGWRDFLERILLPAAVDQVISLRQLAAILRNAENSNDALLRYATLPFAFTAEGATRITASAATMAPSGVERARVEVESIVEVHRQNHGNDEVGVRLWTRQVELEEAFRLSRRARGWMTYPWNTTVWDGGNDPPSRAQAYLESLRVLADTLPIFSSEDPDLSHAQPSPSRSAFPDARAEHFDAELSIEGRDVKRLAPWSRPVADAPLLLGDASTGYLYPGAVSGWFRADGGQVTGTLLDLGADADYRDRVSLAIDQGDLVARVRDPAGDDPDDLLAVANEIRFPVAGQIEPNTWYHFTVSFAGSAPGDVALFVDGLPRGRRTLQTVLTADLPAFAPGDPPTQIAVEDARGFPLWGVIRVGNELIEYSSRTSRSFDTTWSTSGLSAWTGGRGRREFNIVTTLQQNAHRAGETVTFYGYSTRVSSWVVPGGGTLPTTLGRFSAARVAAGFQLEDIVDANNPPLPGSPPLGGPIQLGRGVEGDGKGTKALTEIPLESLDPGADPNFHEAFPATGGYVVVFQFTEPASPRLTPKGSKLFGAELMRYASRQGTTLTGIQRGLAAPPHFPDGSYDGYGGAHAFVTDWIDPQINQNPRAWVFVVPCAVPVSGVTATNYYQPPANDYGVIQLLDGDDGIGTDDGKAEWVQYDTITTDGHFARLDPNRWNSVRVAVTTQQPNQFPPQVAGGAGLAPVALAAVEGVIGEPGVSQEAGAVFRIRQALSFRGTNNTWTQKHTLPTQAIPAFLVYRGDVFAGRPGRLDRIALIEPQQQTIGFWRTILWGSPKTMNQYWVATREQPRVLIEPGQLVANPLQPPPPSIDSRDYARLLKVPSGELPRKIGAFAAGGSFDGNGSVFPGTVDELEFSAPNISAGTKAVRLGRYVVRVAALATDTTIELEPNLMAYPHGLLGAAGANFLGFLPQDAGVLLLGEELIGYESYDAATGTVTIAPNGRGILGTTPRPHGVYETAVFLEHLKVTQLASGVAATDAALEVEDVSEFAPEGTLLIGSELIHHTRIQGTRFEMPGFEDEAEDGAGAVPGGAPGTVAVAGRRQGNGIFRGRYGSLAVSHGGGELVFRFPFRYWDRWVPGSDAPEVHSLQVDHRSVSAFFRRLWWKEKSDDPNVSVECLARLDGRSRWTAEPNRADGLWLFTKPSVDGGANRIERGGERLEMRFGVRYAVDAFDVIVPMTNDLKRSESWKRVPRLDASVLEVLQATRVLRREERR